MFISIHIPKTAGTTLGYLLDYGTERRILYVYSKTYENVSDEDIAYWSEHKKFVEHQFDVIHGHFFYKKFSSIFPNAKYITCLRHPVERLISQWNHEVLEGKSEIALAASKGMSIVDWVESDSNLKKVLALHLEGRELKDYDFIFSHEKFAESWSFFEKNFSFKRNDEYLSSGKLPRLNDGVLRGAKIELPKSQIDKLYVMCKEDIDFYKQGIEVVNTQLNLN
jgi:hypothetical protein